MNHFVWLDPLSASHCPFYLIWQLCGKLFLTNNRPLMIVILLIFNCIFFHKLKIVVLAFDHSFEVEILADHTKSQSIDQEADKRFRNHPVFKIKKKIIQLNWIIFYPIQVNLFTFNLQMFKPLKKYHFKQLKLYCLYQASAGCCWKTIGLFI